MGCFNEKIRENASDVKIVIGGFEAMGLAGTLSIRKAVEKSRKAYKKNRL